MSLISKVKSAAKKAISKAKSYISSVTKPKTTTKTSSGSSGSSLSKLNIQNNTVDINKAYKSGGLTPLKSGGSNSLDLSKLNLQNNTVDIDKAYKSGGLTPLGGSSSGRSSGGIRQATPSRPTPTSGTTSYARFSAPTSGLSFGGSSGGSSALSTPQFAQPGASGMSSMLSGRLFAPNTAMAAGTATDEEKKQGGISDALRMFKLGTTPLPLQPFNFLGQVPGMFGMGAGGRQAPSLNSFGAPSTVPTEGIRWSGEQPMKLPPVNNQFDAGAMVDSRQQTGDTTKLPASQVYNDKQQTMEAIYNKALDIKAQLDQMNPTPPEPVVDTLEQLQAIWEAEDPYGLQEAIDDFKRSQTDLFDLHKNALETQKEMQAVNQAYEDIADDINSDPDFPKGLAQRRFQELNKEKGKAMMGFINQMELYAQQIEFQNETVNRNFGIVTDIRDREEKRQERMQSYMEFLVSSGAIGGLSDGDLAAFSEVFGIPVSALRSMGEAAVAGDDKGFTLSAGQSRYDASGNLIASRPSDKDGSGSSSGLNYSTNKAITALETIDDLERQVSGKTVGYGSLTSWVPTSDSRAFKAQLETLKSSIAFNELTAMREASKTGGALGQVSDREGQLLQSALGALDQGQSQEQFKEQLNKIRNSILRWQEAAGSSFNIRVTSPNGEQSTGNATGYEILDLINEGNSVEYL